MNKYILAFIFVMLSGIAFGQSKWNIISYYKTNGVNEAAGKQYSLITINKNGESSLEYFDSGKVSTYKFTLSKEEISALNKKFKKSGIFKLSSAKLKSDNSNTIPAGPSANMTITLEFSKEQKEEMERKKKGNYYEKNVDTDKNEKKESGEKSKVILIPSNYNQKYSKTVNYLFEITEKCVPADIAAKTGMK